MTEDEKKHKVFAKKTIKNFDVGEKNVRIRLFSC